MNEQIPRRGGLLASLATGLRQWQDAERRNEPHRFVAPGAEVLFVENVADILGCGVDHVRRIPRSDLPAARVGRRIIYLRADVVAYAARNRQHSEDTEPPLPSGRAPSAPNAAGATFDAAAAARRLRHREKQ